jgi:hypothetical protein
VTHVLRAVAGVLMVGLISPSRVYADSVDHYLRCFNVACRPDCGRQPQRYGREPAVVLLFGSRSFDMLQPGTVASVIVPFQMSDSGLSPPRLFGNWPRWGLTGSGLTGSGLAYVST